MAQFPLSHQPPNNEEPFSIKKEVDYKQQSQHPASPTHTHTHTFTRTARKLVIAFKQIR
jgi:hypothetical protein